MDPGCAAKRDRFDVPKRESGRGGAVDSCTPGGCARAEACRSGPSLKEELTNFKAKISLSGHDSYGVEDWREGAHDDFVLSVALGVWVGEYAATA